MRTRTFRYQLPLSLLAAFLLASCAAPSLETAGRERELPALAEASRDRPGLGTKWGETRKSAASATAFERATPNRPVAAAEIFYNNRAGIDAMAAAAQLRRVWPVISGPASSLISVGLRDQNGRFLPGLIVGERWFVVGEEGRRYAVVVRNQCDLRLEVVLSVDGLDVIDGRPASVRKRGCVIPPHRTLVVEGFRQSTEQVAAFRFSAVRESYAQEKYRDTRNVGVIGVAIFNERGTFPWTDQEVKQRLRANPFPNRFATPP
jgi:hypothetical protein